jgi:hemerythrin-like domain-containing protein
MATTDHDPLPRAAPPVDSAFLEPMPFALLDEPLEYVFADHFRQRSLCVALKRFAVERRAPRADADAVIAFLERDLPVHHEDEDEDLFPLLRRRGLPEDGLAVQLARLSDDHRTAEPMVDDIIDALAEDPSLPMVRLSRSACELMKAYVAHEHRHLAIENGIVLAIARVRLTSADLKLLSRGMKARRGA